MLRKTAVLIAALSLAVLTLPALAQEDEGGDRASALGVGVFGGYALGDEITKLSVEGENLELDDTPMIGGIFFIDIRERSRYELRIGFGQTTVQNAPVFEDDQFNPDGIFTGFRDVDATLFFLDIAYIPRFGLGEKLRMGIPLGLGWGTLLEDEEFISEGKVPGRSLTDTVSGGSGMSYFVGVQVTLPLGDTTEFFFDARIKRYHRLVNITEQNAQLVEGTVGVLWQF